MPSTIQGICGAGLEPQRVFSSTHQGPLTNMAPGSHPEHLFGLHALQLAQGRRVYQLDLNGHILGSNSVQSHPVFLLEVGVPESKGERGSLSELPLTPLSPPRGLDFSPQLPSSLAGRKG